MKKTISFILTMIVLLNTTIFTYANEELPTVHADGAILMDYKTGRVLYEKNADKPLAMASTTKIMTLILAIESGRLDETVMVSKTASRAPKVRLNLSEGEEVRLGDLLYPLMLESSNDCAVAVAEHLGGSVEGFSAMMNDKAKELGCKDTIFETPNGLDKGDHHSTARDMAIITKYCLNNEDFIDYINTPSKTIKTSKCTYTVNNKNKLLNSYEGANGVKTGYTNKAGQCFIGSAKRGDMQLITVVLASGWGDVGKERKWTDTKNILNYGFDNYKYYQIVNEGDVVGKIDVTRTRTPQIEVALDRSIMLPLNESEANSVKREIKIASSLEAPVESGEIVGTCDILADGKVLDTVGVKTLSCADRHDLETKVRAILESWGSFGENVFMEVK